MWVVVSGCHSRAGGYARAASSQHVGCMHSLWVGGARVGECTETATDLAVRYWCRVTSLPLLLVAVDVVPRSVAPAHELELCEVGVSG